MICISPSGIWPSVKNQRPAPNVKNVFATKNQFMLCIILVLRNSPAGLLALILLPLRYPVRIFSDCIPCKTSDSRGCKIRRTFLGGTCGKSHPVSCSPLRGRFYTFSFFSFSSCAFLICHLSILSFLISAFRALLFSTDSLVQTFTGFSFLFSFFSLATCFRLMALPFLSDPWSDKNLSFLCFRVLILSFP